MVQQFVHQSSVRAGNSKLGVPSVGYLRDIIKLSKKAIEDVNQLDRIVAVSQATKDFHANQGMDGSRITTIHNGVDLDLFKPPVADDRIKSNQNWEFPMTPLPCSSSVRSG